MQTISLIKHVKDIGDSKADLVLKLRVVRAYSVPSFDNKNIASSTELVCHDRNGERIHASIKPDDYSRMDINFLEGKLYAFQFIKIQHNNMRFKTTSNMYKFDSTIKTRAVEIHDEDFPSYFFVFRQFSDLASPAQVNESMLFDIIAKVDYVGRKVPKNVNGRASFLVDVQLKNEVGQMIKCTLWDDPVDEILSFWEDKSNRPIIMVLQMCRAKIFNNEVCICNSFHVTKMMLNATISEVDSFRESLDLSNDTNVSTLLSQSTNHVEEDLNSGRSKLVTIKSLVEEKQVGTFWVYGMIDSVRAKGSWYYLSCTRCSKKVTKVGDKISCDKCHLSDATGTLRYKLILCISDETGDASLLLWNKECVELIGKTATELKDADVMGKRISGIPSEITTMVDREVMFKIHVKHDYLHGQPFNVVAINSDVDIVSKYCGNRKSTLSNESCEPDLLAILASSEFIDETPGSFKKPIYCSPDGSPTTGLTSENADFRSIKRKLEDQFSSSVNSKKLRPVVVKIEKE